MEQRISHFEAGKETRAECSTVPIQGNELTTEKSGSKLVGIQSLTTFG
jgi:hypothetical protein